MCTSNVRSTKSSYLNNKNHFADENQLNKVIAAITLHWLQFMFFFYVSKQCMLCIDICVISLNRNGAKQMHSLRYWCCIDAFAYAQTHLRVLICPICLRTESIYGQILNTTKYRSPKVSGKIAHVQNMQIELLSMIALIASNWLCSNEKYSREITRFLQIFCWIKIVKESRRLVESSGMFIIFLEIFLWFTI